MGSEALRRAFLLALALLVLASGADAQGRRGKGRGKKPPQRPPKAGPKNPGKSQPPGIPGFDEPARGKKKPQGKKPAGKAPAAQKKPAPPKPPDPMKEADKVTTAADDRLKLDQERQKLLREHFRLCDLDGNGWISLREAEVTLSFDRGEYGRADTNKDGRVAAGEFAAQQVLVLARLGVEPAPARTVEPAPAQEAQPAKEPVAEPPVAAPRVPRSELRALYPKPSDLIRRYDEDASKGLGVPEVGELCAEVGLELSPEQVVETMDRNDSHQLEVGELLFVAYQAARHLPESLRPPASPAAAPAPAPTTATDVVPGAEPSAASAPRRTPAEAASHFGRLDPDGDGWITEADLRGLQSPARLDVRLKAVLSAMDRDGDGRLSEAEFRGSMRDGAR